MRTVAFRSAIDAMLPIISSGALIVNCQFFDACQRLFNKCITF